MRSDIVTHPTAADLVVELLRTLDEARAAWNRLSGGGGVMLMPTMYSQGSYSELERRLQEMRDGEWRRQWWHLTTRYRSGVEVRMVIRNATTTKGKVPVLPSRTELRVVYDNLDSQRSLVRVYAWNEVDEGLVAEGVRRLCATMYDGARERIHLPVDVLHRLMGRSVVYDSDDAAVAVF